MDSAEIADREEKLRLARKKLSKFQKKKQSAESGATDAMMAPETERDGPYGRGPPPVDLPPPPVGSASDYLQGGAPPRGRHVAVGNAARPPAQTAYAPATFNAPTPAPLDATIAADELTPIPINGPDPPPPPPPLGGYLDGAAQDRPADAGAPPSQRPKQRRGIFGSLISAAQEVFPGRARSSSPSGDRHLSDSQPGSPHRAPLNDPAPLADAPAGHGGGAPPMLPPPPPLANGAAADLGTASSSLPLPPPPTFASWLTGTAPANPPPPPTAAAHALLMPAADDQTAGANASAMPFPPPPPSTSLPPPPASTISQDPATKTTRPPPPANAGDSYQADDTPDMPAQSIYPISAPPAPPVADGAVSAPSARWDHPSPVAYSNYNYYANGYDASYAGGPTEESYFAGHGEYAQASAGGVHGHQQGHGHHYHHGQAADGRGHAKTAYGAHDAVTTYPGDAAASHSPYHPDGPHAIDGDGAALYEAQDDGSIVDLQAGSVQSNLSPGSRQHGIIGDNPSPGPAYNTVTVSGAYGGPEYDAQTADGGDVAAGDGLPHPAYASIDAHLADAAATDPAHTATHGHDESAAATAFLDTNGGATSGASPYVTDMHNATDYDPNQAHVYLKADGTAAGPTAIATSTAAAENAWRGAQADVSPTYATTAPAYPLNGILSTGHANDETARHAAGSDVAAFDTYHSPIQPYSAAVASPNAAAASVAAATTSTSIPADAAQTLPYAYAYDATHEPAWVEQHPHATTTALPRATAATTPAESSEMTELPHSGHATGSSAAVASSSEDPAATSSSVALVPETDQSSTMDDDLLELQRMQEDLFAPSSSTLAGGHAIPSYDTLVAPSLSPSTVVTGAPPASALSAPSVHSVHSAHSTHSGPTALDAAASASALSPLSHPHPSPSAHPGSVSGAVTSPLARASSGLASPGPASAGMTSPIPSPTAHAYYEAPPPPPPATGAPTASTATSPIKRMMQTQDQITSPFLAAATSHLDAMTSPHMNAVDSSDIAPLAASDPRLARWEMQLQQDREVLESERAQLRAEEQAVMERQEEAAARAAQEAHEIEQKRRDVALQQRELQQAQEALDAEKQAWATLEQTLKNEQRVLEQRADELQQEQARLLEERQQIASLRQRDEQSLAEAHAKAREAHAALAAEQQQLQAAVEKAALDRQHLDKNKVRLQQMMADFKAQAQAHSQSQQQTHATSAALQQRESTLQQRESTLQQREQELEQRERDVQTQAEAVAQQQQRLTERDAAIRAQQAALEKTEAMHQQRARDFQEALKKATAQQKRIEADRGQLHASQQAFQIDVAQFRADQERHRQAVQQHQASEAALQRQQKALEEQEQALASEKQQLMSQQQQLQSETHALRTREAAFLADTQRGHTDVAEAHQRMAALEEEARQHRSQWDSQKAEYEKLLKNFQSQLEAQQVQVSSTGTQLNKALVQLSTATAEKTALQQQLDAAKASMEERLAAARSSAPPSSEESFAAQVQAANDKLAHMELQLLKANQHISSLSEQLAAAVREKNDAATQASTAASTAAADDAAVLMAKKIHLLESRLQQMEGLETRLRSEFRQPASAGAASGAKPSRKAPPSAPQAEAHRAPSNEELMAPGKSGDAAAAASSAVPAVVAPRKSEAVARTKTDASGAVAHKSQTQTHLLNVIVALTNTNQSLAQRLDTLQDQMNQERCATVPRYPMVMAPPPVPMAYDPAMVEMTPDAIVAAGPAAMHRAVLPNGVSPMSTAASMAAKPIRAYSPSRDRGMADSDMMSTTSRLDRGGPQPRVGRPMLRLGHGHPAALNGMGMGMGYGMSPAGYLSGGVGGGRDADAMSETSSVGSHRHIRAAHLARLDQRLRQYEQAADHLDANELDNVSPSGGVAAHEAAETQETPSLADLHDLGDAKSLAPPSRRHAAAASLRERDVQSERLAPYDARRSGGNPSYRDLQRSQQQFAQTKDYLRLIPDPADHPSPY